MTNRRKFLKATMTIAILAPLVNFLTTSIAWAGKKLTPLPPDMKEAPANDAVVVAIGYKPNIKDIDYTKYPQRKNPAAKKQFCNSCSLYTPVNDSWGKCQMITSGAVAAEGWCASWNKKG